MAIPDDILAKLPAESLSDISSLIRDGDILLCSATDLGSRLISWSTRSRWTHVALAYLWPGLGRILAFESVHTIGVRAVPIETFVKRTSSGVTPYPGQILLARHADFDRHVAADPGAMARMSDFAVSRFGAPFASGEVLKIAMRLALGRTGLKTPAPLAPDDEFICSEYVARCLEQVGIEIPWDGRGFIAPGDIAAAPGVTAVARFKT